jgi:hypothetical protein
MNQILDREAPDVCYEVITSTGRVRRRYRSLHVVPRDRRYGAAGLTKLSSWWL